MVNRVKRMAKEPPWAVVVSLMAFVAFGCKPTQPSVRGEVWQPKILPAVSWGGVLPSGSFRAQTPEYITILHSGSTPPAGVDTLKYMKNLQQQDIKKGWGDLGAHFYLDPMGNIYQSRRIELKGRVDEEIQRDTTGHVFLMLLGDYNTLVPSEEFQEQFIALVGWLSQHHEIPLDRLKGWDAYVVTGSPGQHIREWLESPAFEVRIKEYLGIPLPTPTVIPTPTLLPTPTPSATPPAAEPR